MRRGARPCQGPRSGPAAAGFPARIFWPSVNRFPCGRTTFSAGNRMFHPRWPGPVTTVRGKATPACPVQGRVRSVRPAGRVGKEVTREPEELPAVRPPIPAARRRGGRPAGRRRCRHHLRRRGAGRGPDHPLGGGAACAALVARQQARGSVDYPASEVEPYVAADPADPRHLVGSAQQDRWNDGGSNGLTDVVSRDGGATWTPAAAQPRFSICAGAPAGSPGYFQRTTDPWVSFSADGRVVYSIADSFNADGPASAGRARS